MLALLYTLKSSKPSDHQSDNVPQPPQRERILNLFTRSDKYLATSTEFDNHVINAYNNEEESGNVAEIEPQILSPPTKQTLAIQLVSTKFHCQGKDESIRPQVLNITNIIKEMFCRSKINNQKLCIILTKNYY